MRSWPFASGPGTIRIGPEGGQAARSRWPRPLFYGSWLLILIALALRAWRDPVVAGGYDQELDALLYSGQRLLAGGFLYADHFLAIQPIAQYLYALSAWLGSLQAHRLLLFLVDLAGGGLLIGTFRHFARARLIPLLPHSLIPPMGGVLFVIFSQMFKGGAAGNLHHYANLFLIVALFGISRSLARSALEPSLPWSDLLLAGAALFLAINCFLSLISPILIAAAVVLVQSRRPLPALGALLLGGLLAAAVVFLPYLFLPGGPALAWAGAVLLPLQWAGSSSSEVMALPEVTGRLLATGVAGLPIWLLCVLPALGLLRLAARQWRAPVAGSDEPLLVPAIALIVLVDMGWSLQRGRVESQDLLLMVVPLLLLIGAGLAELEANSRRGSRGLAVTSLLVFTLIFLNNIFVARVFSTPRQPSGLVAELERDRSILRQHLGALPAAERGFTAPQDTALQWQVGMPASTQGIGPEWSLNQQKLQESWATRTLGLPVGVGAVCRQLTAPANRQLVWRRTDPTGPNTEAFLRSCLASDGGRWEDLSGKLGLRTGQFRLFRRDGP